MFRLVDRPTLMPAKTLIGSTVGPVVDTEVILKGGGRVYISRIEAGEIGRHFGMLTPEAAAEKDARIAMLEAENADWRRTVARIRSDVLAAV